MSDIFKRYDFSLKQAVVDKDSDYSMLHHYYYACACVLFELCRVYVVSVMSVTVS